MRNDAPPLIVTLKIDASSQLFFDALRAAHFPKHVNYLKAHLTLFHDLPSSESFIGKTLLLVTEMSSFPLNVSGLKHIGNGVAYSMESRILQELHSKLQQDFKPWLNRQDAKKLWPHITIQNQVTNYKSLQLFNLLSAEFKDFTILAVGFQTWLYLNGPWELKEEFLFNG